MRNKVLSISFTVIFGFLSFFCFGSEKQTGSLEYMTGTGDMHGMRLAYRPTLNHTISLPLIGKTNVVWEASLNLYDIHGSANNEATFGLSVSPVFVKKLGGWSKDYPIYLEAGIGLAFVHEQKFGGVDIGSDYQFEDRLGLRMQMGANKKSSIGVRLLHYSNGGFNTKNPGLDYLSFVYYQEF